MSKVSADLASVNTSYYSRYNVGVSNSIDSTSSVASLSSEQLPAFLSRLHYLSPDLRKNLEERLRVKFDNTAGDLDLDLKLDLPDLDLPAESKDKAKAQADLDFNIDLGNIGLETKKESVVSADVTVKTLLETASETGELQDMKFDTDWHNR